MFLLISRKNVEFSTRGLTSQSWPKERLFCKEPEEGK